MANFLLVDSDILIDAGRGTAEAVNRLNAESKNATLAISTITYMELLVGCRNRQEQQQIEKFLRRFQVVRLDATTSDTAVTLLRQYRLSHGLLMPDALIAATALANNIPLLTKNQRDYRFISGLQLLPYP